MTGFDKSIDLSRAAVPAGAVIAIITLVLGGIYHIDSVVTRKVEEKAALFALHSSQHTKALEEMQRQLDKHALVSTHPGSLKRDEYNSINVELSGLREEVQKLREMLARIEERVGNRR